MCYLKARKQHNNVLTLVQYKKRLCLKTLWSRSLKDGWISALDFLTVDFTAILPFPSNDAYQLTRKMICMGKVHYFSSSAFDAWWVEEDRTAFLALKFFCCNLKGRWRSLCFVYTAIFRIYANIWLESCQPINYEDGSQGIYYIMNTVTFLTRFYCCSFHQHDTLVATRDTCKVP